MSNLDKKMYSKSSMVGISHAIEDIVLHFGLKAELYVFFQDYEFFSFEKEKYEVLDRLCQKVIVFMKNIKFHELLNFHNTIFIELSSDCPFCDEWNIILHHPEQSIVFSTTELYEFNNSNEDSLRKFNGFLSFSPATTIKAVNHIIDALKDYGECYRPIYNVVKDLSQKETYLNKKTSFFINRTLNEIEEKTEIIINNNSALSTSLQENDELTFEILKRLCYAAEYKDEDSALHLVRMSYYSTVIYREIESDKKKINSLTYASLLHDIGKIGIPDAILLKPGPLTKEEFEIIKTHCSIGANILSGSEKKLVQMS